MVGDRRRSVSVPQLAVVQFIRHDIDKKQVGSKKKGRSRRIAPLIWLPDLGSNQGPAD
jgi:hypothetical protein